MFGGGEEDDADFLSPTGGTRLASLFGMDQTAASTGNEFFQYTPPKQPKKGQPGTAAGPPSQKPPGPVPAPGVPSVFIAAAVHAYRFTNGQYVKQGKFGAAVVGSHATKEYRILLYINQQQQIAAARIHSSFVFTVQPNNYGTFYDDQRQNWSIMFESEKAAIDFSKQLCIAKYNSGPSTDSVLYQDLVLGGGQGVEVGDALEMAFTGWLFQNDGLGQVFDSTVSKGKFLRLKLGSGKVIKGWEDGLVGLKKGGRRFLLIPPALGYGSQGIANHIPPDSTLAFEVEVKRVRLAKEASANGQSLGLRDSLVPSPGPNPENLATDPAGLPPSMLPPKPGEPAVRAKSNSISEQLANPDLAKAKLISRMAKMGQPMLPFLSGTSSAPLDSSDSEIEDPNALRGTIAQPVPSSPQTTLPQMTAQAPQPVVSGLQVPSAAVMPAVLQPHPGLPGATQGFQPYAGVTYSYPQTSAAASQLQPIGAVYPTPFQAGDIGSFLMTESRQQNTEIRLAVGKVADKMDQLATKVEELQKQNSGHALLPGISSVTMETSMIMSNIQRIIQENERLKQEIFEKSSRIEEQNEKISELINRNQRYVEQSNLLMEQRNNSLQMTTEHTQARVLHAEQEKVKVTEELSAATAQISQLQIELTNHQKKEMDLRSQLNMALKEAERHGAQLDQLRAQLAELRESSEDTRSKFQVEKQSRKQLDGKVASLEEELADLRVEKGNLEKNLFERRKKSLLERKQAEEEMDEIRRSHQEELDKLRQLLKKAPALADQAASEEVPLVQDELESQWEAKCERLLSSAKEHHAHQYQEVCEQRDALQEKVSQLEEKYLAVQSQVADLRAHYEKRIQELQKAPSSPAGSTEEVKKIMNGVFQSLRGQFELEETYSGRVILGVVMNTIKTITLKLLERQEGRGLEEERPDPTERKQASPAALDEEHQRDPPQEPPVAASSSSSADLQEGLDGPPSISLERGQDRLASEAQTLEALGEQTPLALKQPAQPSPGLSDSMEEEEEEEEWVPNAQDQTCTIEVAAAVSALQEPPPDEGWQEGIPRQDSAGSTPPSHVPRQDSAGSAPPSHVSRQDSAGSAHPSVTADKQDLVGATHQPKPVSSPSQVDSSILEDKDTLFKAATRKPSAAGGLLEDEEDEEELSLKGRPPPTPLFGDDDDDDLDWLG